MNGQHLPYGRQWIDGDDIGAVTEALRSDRITQGSTVSRFEEELAAYCGASYAVAVSSGTAGLHLACLAAGIGPGQKAITSPLTFVASANCVLYCGARPEFVDIDPRTYNIDAMALQGYLCNGRGPEVPSAVIPVHFSGQPCDMERISQVARSHGLSIVEDACHALGASWRDNTGIWRKIGSCSHSDMTVFSFHPVKHITTGEGGAITTNDETLYQKLIELRTHGITKDPDRMEKHDGPWYYEMHNLGYNYRITDLQCALGISQLKRLEPWVARRREIAALYDRAFGRCDELITPHQSSRVLSSYHLYVLQTRAERRGDVFAALHKREIGTQVHYIPVHLQPYYRRELGYSRGDFPHAEGYYDRCFSLPIFPQMTDGDVERVIESVRSVAVAPTVSVQES
jgi:UDP-4-amino-4,6-dideoxy-N-acetyl-beta-L-altrosamine transaminase